MRFRTFALLFLVALVAMPVAAQEQRASIEGVVKDASGAVLPGVTVEAKNLSVGSVVTATTDERGTYRFPALAPGNYEITAALQGFNTAKSQPVRLALGQLKTIDMALTVGGVTENVVVTADTPLVDVKQSARATSIRNEQIDLLPKGRDFTSIVTQAAGANNESKSGGVMIDGASASENRYIVDGAETTNLQNGTSGKTVLADFVEEVQVKSSGYTAEFGGATGGVISVITRSGTNTWRGNVLFNFQGSALNGPERPTLRLLLADATKAEYITYPKDTNTRFEPGLSFGGPIMKDKTWFYLAYQPTFVKTTRSVKAQADGSTVTKEQTNPSQFFSVNNTSQLGSSVRTRIAFNNSWSKTTGTLPALAGTDKIGVNYATGSTRPNWSLGAQLDWVVTPVFYIGARFGYYTSDNHGFGIPVSPRFVCSTSNSAYVGASDPNYCATGYSSIPTNSLTTRDKQKRLSAQMDATWYGNLGGQHTLKGGVQLDRIGNDVLSGEQGNIVTMYWGADRFYAGQQGTYGYYEIRSNGPYPKMGLVTEGNVSTNNLGLFLQDAWTISNKLTINLGIRTENEKVPAYAAGPDIPTYGIEFKFSDKFAPRAGFAYDLRGDGKWKAYGSWGVFYDIFKLELPRGSFGGDKWLRYYYKLDTLNFTTLVSGASCPPTCSGQLLSSPNGIDMRHPSFGSDAIEPNLKPMQSQEMSFGLEHQLSSTTALSLRYVRKWLVRAIDDTGSLDADNNEIYIIANPGEGLTKFAAPGVALPKPERVYNGVELTFTKNFSKGWYLRTSYLWSRLFGNYSGLSQSDENGRTSPNVGRLYDYPTMSFDQSGNPVNGVLATDRTHQVKAQFIYQLSEGTSIGLNQFVASGIPKTSEMAAGPQSSAYPLFYKGRGDAGRMPMYSQTDLQIQQEFKLGGAKRVQLSINVLNLFNQKTATNYNQTVLASGQSVTFNETAFYAHQVAPFDTLAAALPKNPRYMMDSGFQSSISARIGAKFIF
jgi:hypothetical protein